MAQPQKIITSIANHINKCGRWNLSKFTYNSWLTLSDNLLNIDIEEAYTIKALTYYANGESLMFLEYATKLIEVSEKQASFSIYLTAIHNSGLIKKSVELFDDYIKRNQYFNIEHTLLRNHATHSRCALENETLEKCYDKFQGILSDELKSIMMQTIYYNNQDLEVLKYAQIDKELFLEVMGVAIKTLSEFGNFTIGYRVNARYPNDDIVINIVSEQIDIELMNELNEAWLENILDHQTDYEFKQISRLLVNFRPVSNNDGVIYAN